MSEYSGIYGIGYKDENGSLYLNIGNNLLLIREVNGNRTYNVAVVDEVKIQHPESLVPGLSLLENISLREWRRFFVEIHNPKKIEEIKESLIRSEGELWSMC